MQFMSIKGQKISSSVYLLRDEDVWEWNFVLITIQYLNRKNDRKKQ